MLSIRESLMMSIYEVCLACFDTLYKVSTTIVVVFDLNNDQNDSYQYEHTFL